MWRNTVVRTVRKTPLSLTSLSEALFKTDPTVIALIERVSDLSPGAPRTELYETNMQRAANGEAKCPETRRLLADWTLRAEAVLKHLDKR
jgi:hypothetical protein